jgi:hypothetical protein
VTSAAVPLISMQIIPDLRQKHWVASSRSIVMSAMVNHQGVPWAQALGLR